MSRVANFEDVAARQADATRPLADILREASTTVLGAPLAYDEAALERILSPRHFVDVRRTFGGPAPEETARAADASLQKLGTDQAWWTATTEALKDAERRLAERAGGL